MAELKNIRIAVSGIYDYSLEELPSLRLSLQDAPEWVERKRIYKVYRPALVLAKACAMFKMLPLTHEHPIYPVDSQNFRNLIVGYTGENPTVEYIADTDEVGIRSTALLYDDEALNAYESGEIQLSPGYLAEFEWKKGIAPNGQEYDILMKEITGVNHLALLKNGRGGKFAVVLDGASEMDFSDIDVFKFIKIRNELAAEKKSKEAESAQKSAEGKSEAKSAESEKATVSKTKTVENEKKTGSEVAQKGAEKNRKYSDFADRVSDYIKQHGEPSIVKGRYWNGTVYGGGKNPHIYLDGKKKYLSESDKKEFGL